MLKIDIRFLGMATQTFIMATYIDARMVNLVDDHGNFLEKI